MWTLRSTCPGLADKGGGKKRHYLMGDVGMAALSGRSTPPSQYYTRAERVVFVKYFSKVLGESISVSGLPVLASLAKQREMVAEH
jgi:hypothetical protein